MENTAFFTNYGTDFTVFMWFRGQFRLEFLEEMNLTRLILAVNRVSVDAVL